MRIRYCIESVTKNNGINALINGLTYISFTSINQFIVSLNNISIKKDPHCLDIIKNDFRYVFNVRSMLIHWSCRNDALCIYSRHFAYLQEKTILYSYYNGKIIKTTLTRQIHVDMDNTTDVSMTYKVS